MKLLLDTHLLLWAAGESERLSVQARDLISDKKNTLLYSAASLWAITIKNGLGRDDFQIDVQLLRQGLIDNEYIELPITSKHAIAIDCLPPIHKDPFDRILVAQTIIEGITLLTTDSLVAQYHGSVKKV